MSKFWDKLSARHKEMLKNGTQGFRNTVATRYFTDRRNDNEAHIKYTIIDISPALDLAREHLTKEFPNADITFLRVPDKSLGADLYIAISVLTELSEKELADYFEMFATGKYLYFKDWKSKVNPDNGTTFSEDSFPIPSKWKRMFKRDDPITYNFYDAMYKIT